MIYTDHTCHDLHDLTLRAEFASCHYLSKASRRFFRSRIGRVYPTRDGAVVTETIGASFDASAGRAAKCTLFKFYRDPDTARLCCDVRTLYSGLGSGDPLHVQKRAALAAAKFVRYR